MGTGGYKTVVPKWEQTDARLIAAGILPDTTEWPERSRHWFYGHGALEAPETGKAIALREQIKTPSTEMVKSIKEVREGKFQPERENDKMTCSLENPKHIGRTRGKGPGVPWRDGFPDWNNTYGNRQRKKEAGGRPAPEGRKKERGIGTHAKVAAGATGHST